MCRSAEAPEGWEAKVQSKSSIGIRRRRSGGGSGGERRRCHLGTLYHRHLCSCQSTVSHPTPARSAAIEVPDILKLCDTAAEHLGESTVRLLSSELVPYRRIPRPPLAQWFSLPSPAPTQPMETLPSRPRPLSMPSSTTNLRLSMRASTGQRRRASACCDCYHLCAGRSFSTSCGLIKPSRALI